MSFKLGGISGPKVMADAYLQDVPTEKCFACDNGRGRPMVARLLYPGDPYGREGCLTWGEDAGSCIRDEYGRKLGIEFYDATYRGPNHGPLGQFTGGRYYLEDLLRKEDRPGIWLNGGVPEWVIDAAPFAKVVAWVESVTGGTMEISE